MPRTLKWTGIVGEAAQAVGGANLLAKQTGLPYTRLRSYALGTTPIPPIIQVGLFLIINKIDINKLLGGKNE